MIVPEMRYRIRCKRCNKILADLPTKEQAHDRLELMLDGGYAVAEPDGLRCQDCREKPLHTPLPSPGPGMVLPSGMTFTGD